MTEAELHRAVAGYFRVALIDPAFAIHVRNERSTGHLRAVLMGMLPGFPDWLVFCARGKIAAIELKRPGWRAAKVEPQARLKLTKHEEEQLFVHDMLSCAGIPVAICESVEEVEAFLRGLGAPLRARVAA